MSDDSPTTFPAKLFKRIMETLLSDTVNNTALLGRFEEYLAYDDVRYYTLRNVFSACRNTHAQETLQGNLYTVLENISLPPKGQDNTLSNFLCSIGDAEKDIRTLQRHRHLYSSAWIHFLKMKLSATLYRKVLVILPDKVMSNMTSPLSLCDFLSQAFNVGGVISLLASNGLFILITKYNLHYPDFYKKLYSLFEPSIFHVKYKARFFHLCDLFLSSTHLPAHLVAAFAKRLARISLSAPPAGLLVAVPFIYNMIIRHPACKKLIHRPDSDMSFDTDPYDPEEEDPEKCGAMNSCLWELKSLQYHYHPDVFKIAKKMDVGIPDMEIDLAEKFDLTANDLFEKEVQKKQKTVAVTFEPPKGLLGGKDDKLNMFWTL
ncbi:NOC4B-like protein [Mya arenaria]|uniref:NOC4B-like protein n=2 Tax=Mya arenaria TaxID=6604 RepID=A0ABY7DWD4_MYAAR|nr:NOC4B-like protein [Mya arenaria]